MNATVNQKRAKVGGEVGVNGEFYEGGKFLPSTEKAKGKRPARKPGKQQVEPYKWEVPAEGMVAIFHHLLGTVAQWQNGKVVPFEAGIKYYGNERFGLKVAELCERYNRGERWVRMP